jgi:hypothetical protein
MVQLICLEGKEYRTVITVTQMCKKAERVTCTLKHVVDKCGSNGVYKVESNVAKKTLATKRRFPWQKPMTRLKAIRRRKGIKIQRRKRLACVITVRRKGTLKSIAGRKIRHRCPSCIGKRRMLRLRNPQLQLRKSTFYWQWT